MPESQALSPCKSMQNAVTRLANGERRGLWLWYARLHTLRCPRCRKALDALTAYFTELRRTKTLEKPSMDWTRFHSTLDADDQTGDQRGPAG